jgi:Asp-tRNA(Asn)/Glu-tRNA(Gln) amidotransferase A subunit family amidase
VPASPPTEARYDPRVALRIRRGATMSAADYIDLLAARRAWINEMASAFDGLRWLLSPTGARAWRPNSRRSSPATSSSSRPMACCYAIRRW